MNRRLISQGPVFEEQLSCSCKVCGLAEESMRIKIERTAYWAALA
ncbi:hypothetical protein [Blastococcus sp. Marseille-P5729]|nr:hypothetical protein [Blastococcus sp. Marseille-P5729]